MSTVASVPKTNQSEPESFDPVSFIDRLEPEDKEEVLVALLRELIAFHGGSGLIPIETPDGESLGYFVPPQAATAQAAANLPALSAERGAELARRIAMSGSAIPAQTLISELRARADALQTRAP